MMNSIQKDVEGRSRDVIWSISYVRKKNLDRPQLGGLLPAGGLNSVQSVPVGKRRGRSVWGGCGAEELHYSVGCRCVYGLTWWWPPYWRLSDAECDVGWLLRTFRRTKCLHLQGRFQEKASKKMTPKTFLKRPHSFDTASRSRRLETAFFSWSNAHRVVFVIETLCVSCVLCTQFVKCYEHLANLHAWKCLAQ